jgi:hypothetical protein
MPELEMAVPCDVRGGQDGDAARQVESDAEIAAVEAVDQHAADEGNEQARQGDDDDLQADFHGGVGGGHDEPADTGEIQPAAEEGNEHGGEEIAEAALRPDERPVHAV